MHDSAVAGPVTSMGASSMPTSRRPMNAPSSRVLVLDFGGVISRTLFETHPETEATLGLPPGTLTWCGPFAPETDPLWQSMQRGEVSERDYWLTRSREVGALLGETWTEMQQLVQRARGSQIAATLRPEAIAAIETAHARGHRLAILSNELDLFYGKHLRTQLRILDRFAAIVDATYTGILKPDLRAYAACEEVLGVQPADCVFVDDQPRNVEGALQAGWRAVRLDVRDPATAFDEALRLLAQTA